MYASSGNMHFFTKSCHCQTYQNYEQSRQKSGTILENKVFYKSKFSKTFFNKSWSPRGSFKNYVDQFLSYFDHLPTYRGLSWTFSALPTLYPRGHRKKPIPLANLNLTINIKYLVYFGLPSNPINIHKQKLPGEKKNIS